MSPRIEETRREVTRRIKTRQQQLFRDTDVLIRNVGVVTGYVVSRIVKWLSVFRYVGVAYYDASVAHNDAVQS